MNQLPQSQQQLLDAPRCNHIKANGSRCASAALRSRRYCYFHHRTHDLRRMRAERPNSRLQLPLLEDANSIQMAIQQVADAVAEERMESRRAGLLLFAFQTAASNLKRVDFEPVALREELDPTQGSELHRILMEELFGEDWKQSEEYAARVARKPLGKAEEIKEAAAG